MQQGRPGNHSNTRNTGLWLVQSDRVTWIPASIGREPQQHQEWSGPKSELVCHFWNSRKTAMTIISQQLATRTVKHIQKMSPRYLDTGIWLVQSDHMTWILASDWLWGLGTWCKYSWLMNSKLHLLDGCQSESILTPHPVLTLALEYKGFIYYLDNFSCHLNPSFCSKHDRAQHRVILLTLVHLFILQGSIGAQEHF